MAAGSAGDGIKFVMYFSVEGSGEDDLKRIANAMKGIVSTANQAESAMGGFAAQAMAVQQAFDKIGEAGSKMLSVGAAGIKMYAGGVEEMMNSLSPFETSMNRMMMIGKKSRQEAIALGEESLELVKYTPFQAEQIMKMQESLAAAKISMEAYKNSAGGAMTLNDAVAAGFSKVDKATLDMAGNMKISATSAMADLAAFTGQSGYQVTTFVRGMDRALQTGNLRMLFDQVPVAMRQAIFETTGGQMKITAQKAMDNMFKFLSQEGAVGAAAMASATYDGIISNFKDLPVVLAEAVGGLAGTGGFYDKIRTALADVYASIQSGLVDVDGKTNPFITSLKEGLAPVLEIVVGGLKMASAAIKTFISFVGSNPGLVKFTALLGLAGSVLLTVGGAALVVVGSLGGLIAAIVTIGTVVAPVLPAVLAIAAAFTALAVGGIAVAGAAALAFANDFAGIKTLFTDVWVVGKAVVDVLSDWNGSLASISLESKTALEERGLMGSFLKVVNVIRQVETFFEGFSAGFMTQWDKIGGKFSEAWEKFSGAFGRIGTAIKAIVGVLTGGLDQSQALVDESTSAGMTWGNRAASVLDTVADVATAVSEAADAAIAQAPAMISMFATVYEGAAKTWAIVKMLGNTFAFWGNVIEASWQPVVGVIMAVVEGVNGLQNALAALATGDVKGAVEAVTKSIDKMDRIAQGTVAATVEHAGNAGKNLVAVGDAGSDFVQAGRDADRMRDYAAFMANPNTVGGIHQRVQGQRGMFPVPPAHMGAPPPRDQWDSIDKKDREERLGRASGMQPGAKGQTSVKAITKVMLDGKEIAEVTWEHFKEKLEAAGFHPSAED